MANSGHIIVQADSDVRFERSIRHAIDTADTSAAKGKQLPYFDEGEGLYDIDPLRAPPKRLTRFQLREMARAFSIAGVKTRVEFTKTELLVHMRGYRKTNTAHFSLATLPFEGQARAFLASSAESVQG